MSKRLRQHLDQVFAPYEGIASVKELKEELYTDLKEKLSDLKSEGHDDEAAFTQTVDSIGDISELMESINAKTSELQRMVGMDFSKSNLKTSDFHGVEARGGKFDYSNLQGADFSEADLAKGSFKCSNLDGANFNGADLSAAKLVKSNLRGASFLGTNLDGADFSYSNVSGISFDNQRLSGTVFDYAGLVGASFRNAVLNRVSFKTVVKKVSFEGATMDKLTYAILKGYKADLTKVTVV